MFYVYLLQSGTRIYVGITSDLKRRVKEHNSGRSASTKAFMPWELIFYEAYNNKQEAIRREKYLKATQGRQTIRRMLRHHFETHEDTRFDFQGSTTR